MPERQVTLAKSHRLQDYERAGAVFILGLTRGPSDLGRASRRLLGRVGNKLADESQVEENVRRDAPAVDKGRKREEESRPVCLCVSN